MRVHGNMGSSAAKTRDLDGAMIKELERRGKPDSGAMSDVGKGWTPKAIMIQKIPDIEENNMAHMAIV